MRKENEKDRFRRKANGKKRDCIERVKKRRKKS